MLNKLLSVLPTAVPNLKECPFVSGRSKLKYFFENDNVFPGLKLALKLSHTMNSMQPKNNQAYKELYNIESQKIKWWTIAINNRPIS